jgi:hypothetical protein
MGHVVRNGVMRSEYILVEMPEGKRAVEERGC